MTVKRYDQAVLAADPAAAVAPGAGRPGLGLWMALLSAATFGTSGSLAKSLLEAGWTPAAAVTVRVTGAALVLAVPSLVIMRGRWNLLRRNASGVTAYGVMGVAVCQLCYFNAVTHLSVGIALLLEYLAPVLVVGWLWLRTRVRPSALTGIGVLASVLGLLLVLDVTGGGARVDLVGVLWGLGAAVGLVVYFILAARNDTGLPPLVLASGGLTVGAVLLLGLAAAGAIPFRVATVDVTLAGARVSWLVPLLGLVLVAAAFAFVAGIVASRLLGPKVASFAGLTEVLFAVLFAWMFLGELPHLMQLLGGLLVLAGVVTVRYAELSRSA